MKFSKFVSFLTLSAYADFSSIEFQLNVAHSRYQEQFPNWSISSTRRKLKADYWYTVIFKHYLIICLLALVSMSFVDSSLWSYKNMLSVPLILGLAFLPISALIYFTSFYATYLPLLDTCIENYTGNQLAGIQKCKKQQYSVRALLLIQYTFQKIGNLEDATLQEEYTNLLTKQYGISPQMIESAYKEIFLNAWNGGTGRKYTEIIQSFDEAEDYFKSLKAPQAIPILQQIRIKVLSKGKVSTKRSLP